MRFQVKTTEEETRCVVNQTEASVNTNSCVIKFRSADRFCVFMLINLETGSQLTNCSETQTHSSRFTCELSDLEPGTFYNFGIISQTDGEHFNISLQTGKFTVFYVFNGMQVYSLAVSRLGVRELQNENIFYNTIASVARN